MDSRHSQRKGKGAAMPSNMMLEGNVDNRDHIIEQLQAEVAELNDQLVIAKAETARAQRASGAAVSNLRRQLAPLYQALQAVFGEMEAIPDTGAPAGSTGTATNSKVDAVWESWKRKLGGKAAVFIDVLREHGEMNVAQLRVAAQCGQQTVYDTIAKLHKVGLINKNGGRFSLKQL